MSQTVKLRNALEKVSTKCPTQRFPIQHTTLTLVRPYAQQTLLTNVKAFFDAEKQSLCIMVVDEYPTPHFSRSVKEWKMEIGVL